jgi:hypothetical protein
MSLDLTADYEEPVNYTDIIATARLCITQMAAAAAHGMTLNDDPGFDLHIKLMDGLAAIAEDEPVVEDPGLRALTSLHSILAEGDKPEQAHNYLGRPQFLKLYRTFGAALRSYGMETDKVDHVIANIASFEPAE